MQVDTVSKLELADIASAAVLVFQNKYQEKYVT